MITTSLRKVVFLDTNVLHFIHLYLRWAKDGNLFPFGGDIATASNKLNIVKDRAADSLKKGLRTIDYLRREDARVEYSAASELELMAGRARGKAIEAAATEGIPDRWWSHFREREISDRLRSADLIEIKANVEGLRSLLKQAGINADVGRSDRVREVLELAKDVMGLVYMSPVDGVVYAGALVSEADHLISDDNYLRSTATCLRTNRSLRATLKTRTAVVLSRDAGSVSLPDAIPIPTLPSGTA